MVKELLDWFNISKIWGSLINYIDIVQVSYRDDKYVRDDDHDHDDNHNNDSDSG